MSKIDGISSIETDVSSQTATFKARPDLDIDKILDELSQSVTQFQEWKRKQQ